MVFLFYVSGIIALLSTICVILSSLPMHALLYLIVSFISISCVLFSLGALFAGAIEIIVYAGAIMILFVFIVMLLNNMESTISSVKWMCNFITLKACYGVVLSSSVLCIIILYMIIETRYCFIYVANLVIDTHNVGCKLFGDYMLVVEVVSFLLLAALVSVLHVSHQEYKCGIK